MIGPRPQAPTGDGESPRRIRDRLDSAASAERASSGLLRISALLAVGFACFLAVAELLRNWGDGGFWAFWVVDYLAAGFLFVGGRQLLRRKSGGEPLLCGAWGSACAMFYMSFFSHLERQGLRDHGPVAAEPLTAVIGGLFLVTIFGLVATLLGSRTPRRGPNRVAELGTLVFLALIWSQNVSAQAVGAAGRHLESERVPEAEAMLDSLVSRQPGNAEALAELCRIQLAAKRLERAEELYGIAVALDSNQASYHYFLGQIYRARMQGTGLFRDVRLRYGLYLQELGRWDAAFEIFTVGLREDPAWLSGHYQLGRTALLANRRLDVGERALSRLMVDGVKK